MEKATTFNQQIALTPHGSNKDTYRTLFPPDKMGNTAPIAYGGCTIAVAIAAAFKTIPQNGSHKIYSVTGTFLGPARTDRALVCRVRRVRDTRSFVTRVVEVGQVWDVEGLGHGLGGKAGEVKGKGRDGKDGDRIEGAGGVERPCMLITADFMAPEQTSVLTYSASPRLLPLPPISHCLSYDAVRAQALRNGVPAKVVAAQKIMFGLMMRYVESVQCPEGISPQNFMGMLKGKQTSQDHLPLTERVTADYFRPLRRPVGGGVEAEAEMAAFLGFVCDAALSFIGLTHSGMFLGDVGACSSLDFALRFMGGLEEEAGKGKRSGDGLGKVNEEKEGWFYREMGTVTGGGGRTYSEARVWDSKGRMVAVMNQQCIMRPKAVSPMAKSSL